MSDGTSPSAMDNARTEILLRGDESGTGSQLCLSSVARGTFWAGIDVWSQQILQVVTFIYVGNVIGPDQLGIMAVALIYVMLMHTLLMNSFTESLIQRRDLSREHLEAAFWTITGAGCLASVLSLVVAGPLGVLFQEPLVAPITRLLAPTFVLLGVSAFYDAFLRRHMRFDALALRSIASAGLASVVAIVMVRRGYGVWSLVGYQLVLRSVELVTLFWAVRWIPRWQVSRRHFCDLLDFGLHSMGARLVGYLSASVDRICVGLVMGPAALGLYTMARRVVDALTQALTGVLQGVALPVFASMQTDRARLSTAVGLSARFANLMAFPVFFGLAVIAEPLVGIALRPQWQPMVAILHILCLAGILSSVSYFLGAALRALGQARLVFRIHLGLLVFQTGAVVLAAQLNLAAVALASVAVAILALPVWCAVLRQAIGLDMTRFFKGFLPALWSATTMAAVVHFSVPFWLGLFAGWPAIAMMVFTGAATYGLMVAATSADVRYWTARFLRDRRA